MKIKIMLLVAALLLQFSPTYAGSLGDAFNRGVAKGLLEHDEERRQEKPARILQNAIDKVLSAPTREEATMILHQNMAVILNSNNGPYVFSLLQEEIDRKFR